MDRKQQHILQRHLKVLIEQEIAHLEEVSRQPEHHHLHATEEKHK